MGLFSKKGDAHTALILDIGSASVGAAIASFSKGEQPAVLAIARAPIAIQEEVHFSRFVTAMIGALDQALHTLAEGKHKVPATCIVALASPWYISQTKNVSIAKEKQFVVTEAFLADLIKHERALFSSKYTATSNKKEDKEIVVVETEAIGIKLNGYATEEPNGLSAKRLDTAMYMSISQKKVIDAISSHTRSVFNYENIIFHTFPFVGFSVVRDMMPSTPDFMFIDVTGEVTDVSLVRGGVLTETVSFPLGKNFILRRIASGFRTDIAEAASLLSLYNDKKAEPAINERLEKVLIQAGSDWTQAFSKSITEFSGNPSLPHTIFLTADPDVRGWFEYSVQKEAFAQYTSSDHDFDVRFLGIDILEPFVTLSPGVNYDMFLMIEAIFSRRVNGLE